MEYNVNEIFFKQGAKLGLALILADVPICLHGRQG